MELRSRSVIEIIRNHLYGKCNQETIDQLVDTIERTAKQSDFSFVNMVDKTIEYLTFNSFDYAKYNKKDGSFLLYRNGLEYKTHEQIANLIEILSADFTVLDKVLFVNMSNVHNYNSYYLTINFEFDSLRVTHASMKQIIICKGKELDLHNESSEIYSPLFYRRKEFT